MRLKDRIGAAIAGLVLLSILGGVSAGAFWVMYRSIGDGLRAQDWIKVRAQVRSVSEGAVTYAYEWKGKQLYGERAGTFILGGSSEVDDWDDRMDAMLSKAVADKTPVTVFVNPDNPAESMLDREIRWALVMVLTLPFGMGFGAGALAVAYFFGRSALGIRETGGSVPLLKAPVRAALFQWIVAIVWNSVALPIAIVAMPDLWRKGEWFPLVLVSIFPLIGALIVVGAVSSTFRVILAGNPFNARAAR